MSASPAFRCSRESLLRDEPVGGSATHVRGFLLLEHCGPWGINALQDARLPDGLGARLRAAAAAHRMKVLLIRRHGSRREPERPTVIAAYADERSPRLEQTTVADLREVLDLDLSAVVRGRSLGLPASDQPVFAVCTNGRHDACCAELGRPVAAALSRAHPDLTWEISHVGGDRYAANLVVLPRGLYYGRLDPQSAVAVAGTHLGGHVDLDHLRGTTTAPMPVQAAEIALRRRLGETRIDGVRLLERTSVDGLTTARLLAGAAAYDVTVRSSHGPAVQLTCRAQRDNPTPLHEVLTIERVAADDPMTG